MNNANKKLIDNIKDYADCADASYAMCLGDMQKDFLCLI